MLRMGSVKKNLLNAAFAIVIFLLPAHMFATTLDYTFTGVGSGTIAGNTNATFANQAFSVSFVEDTATLGNFGPGSLFTFYSNISGTFTEGAYTTTLTGVEIEVNGNGNTGMGSFETVFLFNSGFGSSIGISSNPNLLGYDLTSPVSTGVVTGVNISAFSDPAGFSTTTGDKVQFTGLQSLDFSVTSAVPEPSTLALLTAGLTGAGMLRRRLCL